MSNLDASGLILLLFGRSAYIIIFIYVFFFFQVFAANSDRNTIVSHVLTPRFRARYVRFVAMTWHGHISMRVELYGCAAP